jgi:hypothetical protein
MLRRLEQRHAPWTPPPDISGWIDAVAAICEASEAGRPFSPWPPQDDEPQPLSPAAQRRLKSPETIGTRIRAQPEWEGHEKDRVAGWPRICGR